MLCAVVKRRRRKYITLHLSLHVKVLLSLTADTRGLLITSRILLGGAS